MAKNTIIYDDIPDLSTPWNGVLPGGGEYSYAGSSVERFLKSNLGKIDSKAGDFYYDSETTKYLVFSDSESRELYLSDRTTYADLLLGSFDAPANYVAEIYMETPASNTVLSGSTGNYVDFTFDITSRTGSSTGESIVATFTFNNSGNIRKVTQIYNAGTHVHYLIDSYLLDGLNTISVNIQGRNTLVGATASVTFMVVNLQLETTMPFANPVLEDELAVPYTLIGSGVKYLEWYIDGVILDRVDTLPDLRVNRTKYINISNLEEGKHNVQFRAYISDNAENYYSSTIYRDFYKQRNTAASAILLGLNMSLPTRNEPVISATQYQESSFLIAGYDSQSRQMSITVIEDETPLQTLAAEPLTIQEIKYTPIAPGEHTLNFSCKIRETEVEIATATIISNVEESEVGISEATDSLLLKLSAKGRSNNETNPGTWIYGDYHTTFNNFSWNEKSGWNNNALIIPAGASIDINIAPLFGNPSQAGRTIEIDYTTEDLQSDDEQIILLQNESTGASLNITSSTATLISSGGANVNTKYRNGDRINLSFIINKTTGDDSRLMFIVNNGKLERTSSFDANDSFNCNTQLHIGSSGCTIKLYSIRIYEKALTVEEAFGNWAIDSENLLKIASDNDILNDVTGNIDADKVNAKIPIIIITGDMQPIFDATDKNVTVYVDVEYRNLQDATKSFTATHLRMRPQGTSSLGYPRKNLRLYTASKYDCVMKDAYGNEIPNGKYSFKDGAAPVNCWTLKADYAESSGSHNTGVARLWNSLMYNAQFNNDFPLRTEAQKTAIENEYPYDVRTTIDGFPIVVFHRQDESSELNCLGQYNFNNDKSTEDVFGFTDIPGFDNSHVQCFEFLANESPICLFDDVSEFDEKWDTAFESRYPDTSTPDLTALKTLATWINSCKNNQEKWNTEKYDHLDVPKLAAYYVYLMRFGAVDQTVKNAMFETEDGVHWFFINYDNDTILGIDNISTVLNRWDYTRETQKGANTYYYAGHNSVLWNCFEADNECMSLVRIVDDALYSAGLTYANMCRMFDVEQCEKWCERIYNDNSRYKYIQPYQEKGSAVLYMLQGDRKSYRHWWLQHRMDMCDAMWASGAYKNRIVRFIAEGANNKSFKIVASTNSYYGYGINSVVQESGIYVEKNHEHTFTIPQTLAIGDPVAIYNANNIFELDLSDYIEYLTTLYINAAVGNNGETNLKTLILGDGEHTNNIFTEIGGLNVITTLEHIDIRGFASIISINLSNLRNLNTFKSANSGLTSFAPASGISLSEVSLPSTIQVISLVDVTLNSLSFTPTTALRSVTLRNCGGEFNYKNLVNNWLAPLTDTQLANAEIVLTGINWTNMTVEQTLKIGKIGTKTLQGKITLSSLTYEGYQQLLEVFGPNVFDPNGTFVIDAPSGILISAPETLQTETTGKATAVVFPLGVTTARFKLYNGNTLIPEDEHGIATYKKVSLNCNTGDISVGAVTTEFNVGISAYTNIQESNKVTVRIIPIVPIGGFTVDDQIYTETGDYNITLTPTNPEYNVPVTNVTLSWEQDDNLSLVVTSSEQMKLKATVNNIPIATKNYIIEVNVTDQNNNTYSGNLNIQIKAIYIQSFDINGPETIITVGSYPYNLTNILPLDHNKGIKQLGVTITDEGGGNPPATAIITSTTTFVLSIESMPEYTTNASVVARVVLDNDDVISKTINVNIKVVSSYDVLDELGVAIMHVDGTFYTLEGWQEAGLTSSDANGIAISDASTNPSSPHRFVAMKKLTLAVKWSETLAEVPNVISSDDIDVLKLDFDGENNTQKIITYFGTGNAPLSEACKATISSDGSIGYLPALGELYLFIFSSTATTMYKYVFGQTISSAAPIASSDQYGTNYVAGLYVSGTLSVSMFKDRIVNYGGAYNVYVGIPFAKIKPVSLNKPVDLGLPSGRLWSNINLGATSPETTGLYFQWGNLDGHDGTDGYPFTQEKYQTTPGSQINTTLPLSNDAANAMLGGTWRIPQMEDFTELLDTNNTTRIWTTINSVSGWRITSKTNSNSIFFPVTGYGSNLEIINKTTNGYYWTSTNHLSISGSARTATFNSSSFSIPQNGMSGYCGYAIRPICFPLHPTSVNITGSSIIGQVCNKTYKRNFNTDEYSGTIQNVLWELTGATGFATISSQTNNSAIITVTAIPNNPTDISLTCTVTFEDNFILTNTKTITLTDLSKEYLTFTALEDTKFSFTKNALQYSLDNGSTWSTLNPGSSTPTVTAGNKILWKQTGLMPGASTSNEGIGTFSSTKNFNAFGNIMSLYYGDNFYDKKDLTGKSYSFYRLFYSSKLTNADIILPATTLAYSCYTSMFQSCKSLTEVPELPATTLVYSCYSAMFLGCTSLVKTPQLPATTLAQQCYVQMFQGCTSLTEAPQLPVTTLADSCYSNMFQGCSSLTEAPELPATTLTTACYSNMFQGCTSLVESPELPATTLADSCYYGMFSGCTSLTGAPELPVTTLANYCYSQMFASCTSLTEAPELPATTLIQHCYDQMFQNCISLVEAPTELPATTLAPYCYSSMFNGCSSLTEAPELPATTLANNCYSGMFLSCTSLTEAPELPVTTLANYCYNSMFQGCSSLTEAPELPATTLTTYCYYSMFLGCTSLTEAPELPATTLAPSCYSNMFQNCTSLTGAPELPVTTLAPSCYNSMFYGCISLTEVPELPATTLTTYCYKNMFYGCTSLTEAPELPATTLAQECYNQMFYGCTSLVEVPTELPATTSAQGCYASMFYDCTSLTKAPELPATTLAPSCYSNMFQNCRSLVKAPELPATTLASSCYNSMFYDCRSLTEAPELPATTLAQQCYSQMFQNCISLVEAPTELPATTLANYCYNSMFSGCTSLTEAPELPATTLAERCYNSMFLNCRSLVKAPELPATTLASSCYNSMFYGCNELSSITCLATNISASACTTNWIYGVATSGTFIKNPEMTSWTTGASGIPGNWTVQDYVFPPTAIDLGLSVKWCNMNVGATLQEESGLYFAWGETTGYEDASTHSFDSSSYSASSINANLTLAQDGAAVTMGGNWRMPTKAEIEELIANTTATETTVNSVLGVRLTSTVSGYTSNSIFIPYSGYYDGTTLTGSGTSGSNWSSTLDSGSASIMSSSSGSTTTGTSVRYYGRTIRAVQ